MKEQVARWVEKENTCKLYVLTQNRSVFGTSAKKSMVKVRSRESALFETRST